MTPPPSPPPTVDVSGLLGQTVGSAARSFWDSLTSSPLLMALVVLFLVVVLVRIFRAIRWMPLRLAGPDRRRLFTGPDRAGILHRAGHRCEHHAWIGGRCPATTNLHVDHIHPHSRGGSTTPGNAQVLCSRHNKEKSNRIPYDWQVRALERRRRRYFPDGISLTVVRRERTAAPTSRRIADPLPGSAARAGEENDPQRRTTPGPAASRARPRPRSRQRS